MKRESEAVDTKYLTKAFGWDSEDVFTQQDIQEFCCILLDAFEKRCKSEELHNFVADVFQGKSLNYITCIDVDYSS